MIRIPRPNRIVNRTDDRYRTRYQNRPIHIRRRNLRKTRPETEEEDKAKIGAGKDIISNAYCAGKTPRAPYSVDHAVAGCGLAVCVEAFAGWENGAGAAAVEEKRGCEKVGGEEAGDGDGDYAVESGSGSDVY